MAAGEEAVIEIGEGQIQSRVGRAPHPDLTLSGPPRAILGLLTGTIDFDLARQLGLTAHGRRQVLKRLRPLRQPSDQVEA
jgi:hypothetical protein